MALIKHRPLSLAIASLALAAFAAPSVGADNARLLARAPQDLVAARLIQPSIRMGVQTLDRAPVALSWPLDATRALDARPQAHVTQSREYWIDASESQMQNGVDLPLSAPGAIVRISPHAGNAAIAAGDVQLRSAGRRLDNAGAIRNAADADALSAAGMDAPQGSVALRLSDAVSGPTQLAVPTARGAYLVHVYEPASPVVLALAADRDGIAGGERVTFRASLKGATLDRIGALVSAPDGASQNVDFVRQRDGSYVGSVTPDVAHASGPGLWEIHAFGVASGRNAVPRDAKSAFAVSVPVARLDGNVARATTRDGVAVRVGVEAVAASRYALSGVLYGTGTDGRLHPVAMAQSAAWLGTGHAQLELRYDAASLSLSAPWEVRDLRLVNQADFSLQERRERAIALQ